MKDWKYNLRKLLANNFQEIPCGSGVYRYEIDKPIKKPKFKELNPAGHFKGRNPTENVGVLKDNWVPKSTILYIGQTSNLKKRFRLRERFASGEPVGAWGGRYLWQLDASIQKKITVRYKEVQNPKEAERAELTKFKDKFGRLPFANLI